MTANAFSLPFGLQETHRYLTSALIPFLRMLLFQSAFTLLPPMLRGIDGVWISVIVAELVSVLLSAAFLILSRERYSA